jgi:hypothetical protein
MQAVGQTPACTDKPGRKTWKCYVIMVPADPANPNSGSRCHGVKRSRTEADTVASAIPHARVEKHFAD